MEFHVDKENNPDKKSWTQSCKFVYGVSTAEDLVSDLVNNGIIKECELELRCLINGVIRCCIRK